MTTLNQYEVQVADILHDPLSVIWSLAQLDAYINEARIQVARDTGCLRSLQQSYLTQAQENYTFGQVTGGAILTAGSGYVAPVVSFSGGGGAGVAATLTQSAGAVNSLVFTSFGSGYSSAPTATVTDSSGPGTGCTLAIGTINVNTYDVLNLSVYWGSERYALLWLPFSDFSAKMRLWTSASYQQRPSIWAVYGENQVFVASPPDQSYACEFDTVILPVALAVGDYTTSDPIPMLYQAPIRFYAAYLAKLNQQEFGEAEMHLQAYGNMVERCGSAYVRRIPDPYGA